MIAAPAPVVTLKLSSIGNSRWARPFAIALSDLMALTVAAAVLHGPALSAKGDWYRLAPIPVVLGMLWLSGLGAQVALSPVHEFRKAFSVVAVVFGSLCAVLNFGS